VKLVRPYFEFTDSLYFGLIKGLRRTGGYQSANIFLLVIAIPLMIWFFLIKSIQYQKLIDSRKSN
jgi:hypothetical protein